MVAVGGLERVGYEVHVVLGATPRRVAVRVASTREGRRYDQIALPNGRVLPAPDASEGSGDALLAEARKAAASSGGNSRPRFAARRRTPAHALGLRENRSGNGSVSRISGKEQEDPAPSLGHSEPAGIENAPSSVAIPAFGQGPEKGSEPKSVACGLSHLVPLHVASASPVVSRSRSGEQPWDVLEQ